MCTKTPVKVSRNNTADLPVVSGNSVVYIIVPPCHNSPSALRYNAEIGSKFLRGKTGIILVCGHPRRQPFHFTRCSCKTFSCCNAVTGKFDHKFFIRDRKKFGIIGNTQSMQNQYMIRIVRHSLRIFKQLYSSFLLCCNILIQTVPPPPSFNNKTCNLAAVDAYTYPWFIK